MGKKITDIYAEYKIMPNLQEHMFRVAAVASLICDNFDGPLPKEEIVTACLLHDMGNIIKFDLDLFPEFREPEGLVYWQGVKNEYLKKYGDNEHIATEKIAEELGVSEGTMTLLKHIGFSRATINELSEFFERKICNYSDIRVVPHGVVSMEERIKEGHNRYKYRKHEIVSDNFETLCSSLRNIEKQIFAKCKIKPEDINDESARFVISELRNFVIPG